MRMCTAHVNPLHSVVNYFHAIINRKGCRPPLLCLMATMFASATKMGPRAILEYSHNRAPPQTRWRPGQLPPCLNDCQPTASKAGRCISRQPAMTIAQWTHPLYILPEDIGTRHVCSPTRSGAKRARKTTGSMSYRSQRLGLIVRPFKKARLQPSLPTRIKALAICIASTTHNACMCSNYGGH